MQETVAATKICCSPSSFASFSFPVAERVSMKTNDKSFEGNTFDYNMYVERQGFIPPDDAPPYDVLRAGCDGVTPELIQLLNQLEAEERKLEARERRHRSQAFECAKLAHSQDPEESPDPVDELPNPAHRVYYGRMEAGKAAVGLWLEQLPEPVATIFRMRYEEGQTFEAIGREFGVTKSAVSQRVKRYECKLRSMLKEQGIRI